MAGTNPRTQRSGQGTRRGERQYRPTDAGIRDLRQARGAYGEQSAKTRPAYGDAGRSSQQAEHAAFGEQLPQDAPSRSAQTEAQGHFFAAAVGARQQQTGDVDAADRQDEPGAGKQRGQRRRHVAHGIGLHSGERELQIFGVVSGIRAADFRRYAIEIALPFRQRHARPQARHQANVILVAVRINAVVECIEDLHVGRHVGVRREMQLEIGRENADQRVFPIHRHALADQPGVAREPATEQAIGEHDGVAAVVSLAKCAALGGHRRRARRRNW